MGASPVEDIVLKALGGAGALGVFAYLAIYVLKWITEKDKLFAGALDRFGERLDHFGAKSEASIDRLSSTILEVDKGHTTQLLEATRQWAGLNERQNATILAFGQKVDHLDERVGRLSQTIEYQGEKIDALARSLPAPPGAGAADFRGGRGRDEGDPPGPRPARP
jgi:hypothetical protein